MSVYVDCPCKSGQKFKFCCLEVIKSERSDAIDKIALRFPIEICVIADTIESQGMGHVMVARRLPHGEYMISNYLLDIGYYGVKNAFFLKSASRDKLHYLLALVNFKWVSMLGSVY